MLTFRKLVYTKTAAKRILEKDIFQAQDYSKFGFIRCIDNNGIPKDVSISAFKADFAEHRRALGKELSAMPGTGNKWHAGKYEVTVHPDYLTCNCQDWRNQKAVGIKTATCKHCYAVLNQLGCNSLAEYLERKSEAGETAVGTNQQAVTTQQSSSSVAPKLPNLSTYLLRWESYGRDHATGKPLEVATTKINRCPTDSELWELRRNAHSKGYKLSSFEKVA